MRDRTRKAVHTERICLAIDLENVGAKARREGRLSTFLDELVAKVKRAAGQGVLLGGIGVGDRDLQRASAFRLADVRVRVHARPHDGPDASDLVLVDYLLSGRPPSTDTVVLASGDHIFADVVAQLVDGGRRVVLMAVPGTVSAELFKRATDFIALDDPR